MAIPRKTVITWLLLAALCALALVWQRHLAYAGYLAVAKNPARIEVHHANASFIWQRDGTGWLIDGKKADAARIEDWLLQLRACYGAYSPSDIAPTDNPQPVTVDIDGQQYAFGAANSFADTHYLSHQGKIYLCAYAVKAALQQPPSLWLENPDA